MNTVAELRGLSSAELEARVLDLQRELFNLRLQRGSDQLSNFSRFKGARREIARVKTILSEESSGSGPGS